MSFNADTDLFVQVKSHKDLAHFETAYVVKLHRVARLAPSQPVRICLIFVFVFYDFGLTDALFHKSTS